MVEQVRYIIMQQAARTNASSRGAFSKGAQNAMSIVLYGSKSSMAHRSHRAARRLELELEEVGSPAEIRTRELILVVLYTM